MEQSKKKRGNPNISKYSAKGGKKSAEVRAVVKQDYLLVPTGDATFADFLRFSSDKIKVTDTYTKEEITAHEAIGRKLIQLCLKGDIRAISLYYSIVDRKG